MSAVLTLVLLFVSSQMEPQPSPVATSQIDRIAEPFKPELESPTGAAPRKPVSKALAIADDEREPAHAANATHKEKQNAPQKEKQDDRSRPAWQHSFG
jgi:hypothetical protein